MHYIGKRQKGSKIYFRNVHSIPFNNDREHQRINESSYIEPVHVQQKKNIDKIMLAVVKQRMFGQLLAKDNKKSLQNFYTVDLFSKRHTNNLNNQKLAKSRQRSDDFVLDLPYSNRKQSCKKHQTIDGYGSEYINSQQLEKSRQQRSMSLKLPQLLNKKIVKLQSPIKKDQTYGIRRIKINQKKQLQRFKIWLGGNITNLMAYDMKVSRQTIFNKYKNQISSALLERFFHFFGFPQSFTLRQFCSLIQNAANCNIKFIYFWVFGIFDQNSNGILQSQDLFRFLQNFGVQNSEIESQIYQIKNYLQEMENSFKPREEKQLTEQILVVNHNLKLDELKDLLKQSQKQRIDVDCVKNTCYHQTLLSIEHDFIERDKLQKIESNQIETRKLKDQMIQIKNKLQNTPGLRLRDFYAIYGTKRPKIFRYFIHLLAGSDVNDLD